MKTMKISKKRVIALVSAVLFLSLIIVISIQVKVETTNHLVQNNNQSDTMQTIDTEGDYLTYESIDELAQADMILLGEPNSSKPVTTSFPDGTLQDFYSLTSFTINKVIKQPSDQVYQLGDVIEIIEPYALINDNGQSKKLIFDGYQSMKFGKMYVIFLKKNSYGQYGIINNNEGKFNLDGTDLDDMKVEKKQLKEKLKAELKQKYHL